MTTQTTVRCFCFPDFQTCDVPPQASNLQPGVVKTQDPQIERDLHLSLEDLYLGCTKKIKISRRVGGKRREERWRQAQKETFIVFCHQVMNADGFASSIKDKILTIDVRPGWKEGTKVIFPKEGDQVKIKNKQHRSLPKFCRVGIVITLWNRINVAGKMATQKFTKDSSLSCELLLHQHLTPADLFQHAHMIRWKPTTTLI